MSETKTAAIAIIAIVVGLVIGLFIPFGQVPSATSTETFTETISGEGAKTVTETLTRTKTETVGGDVDKETYARKINSLTTRAALALGSMDAFSPSSILSTYRELQGVFNEVAGIQAPGELQESHAYLLRGLREYCEACAMGYYGALKGDLDLLDEAIAKIESGTAMIELATEALRGK